MQQNALWLPVLCAAVAAVGAAAGSAAELDGWLAAAGLSQYKSVFLENGFDSPADVRAATEADFDSMKVLLGHRRRLVRNSGGGFASAAADAPSVGQSSASVADGMVGVKEKEQLVQLGSVDALAAPISLQMRQQLSSRLKVAVAVTITHENDGAWVNSER